ncbi:AMP phosphotransferase [Zobellella taiwanensis]|uniref:AMP phosphotransferase n=1 Tax=Zobellella taiwanensis TaxID=347535 RepID=A0A2P7QTN5_9GAMM|nr:AMP phosphotransferase [Zobellella taiwanensis]PSJ41300.1 AMP phosphotransferase [Zobellella taiwanensis]
MNKQKNKEELKPLQKQLAQIHQAMGRQGQSAVIVLEGPDAAGKGGIIRRLAWCLDPRWLSVWPIAAPDAREREQHWLQRFWQRLPSQGRWAVFDRSWYGRVLVERVEGFAEPQAWQRAYREINEFERSITAEHIRLVKIWLDIGEDTQLARFQARFDDPAKQWKLTAEDLRNRARWQDYQQARDQMLELTHTEGAPWHRIDANNKHQARMNSFRLLIDQLGKNLDLTPPKPAPDIAHFFGKTDTANNRK